MHEENPLLVRPMHNNVSEDKSKCYNSRGRPKMEDMIKFSPEPQSAISQLLNKIKTENINGIKLTKRLLHNDKEDNNYENTSFKGKTDYNVEKKSVENKIIVTAQINSILESNINENYNDPEEEEIICQFCSHRSKNMKEYKKHQKVHKDDKRYFCDYPGCSYMCKLSSNLTKHKRVHTGEKPYFCDKCAFRTNFVNSLKVHKRIHTMERPYACKHCDYRANSSSNLKKHCHHRHSNNGNNLDNDSIK